MLALPSQRSCTNVSHGDYTEAVETQLSAYEKAFHSSCKVNNLTTPDSNAKGSIAAFVKPTRTHAVLCGGSRLLQSMEWPTEQYFNFTAVAWQGGSKLCENPTQTSCNEKLSCEIKPFETPESRSWLCGSLNYSTNKA